MLVWEKFFLPGEKLNSCFRKKQKKYAENVSRNFQFQFQFSISKFKPLLPIGKARVFRFLKKMLVLTF